MVSSWWAMTAHSCPMPRSIPQRASGWLGRRGAWAMIVASTWQSVGVCVLLFLILQRYYVRGFMSGAIKG